MGLIGLGVVYFATWQHVEQTRLEANTTNDLEDAARGLREELGRVGNQLNFLSRIPTVQNAVGRLDDVTRPRIESLFEATLEQDLLYDHVSYVDLQGQERVRIERNGGSDVWTVPASILAAAPPQDDTTDAARFLSRGGIYLSRVAPDREAGRIVVPTKPVLRASTPVQDLSSHPAGTIVFSILAARLFESVTALPNAFLLDDTGTPLVGTLPTGAAQVFEQIADQDRGSIWLGNRLYSFTTITPLSDVRPRRGTGTFTANNAGDVGTWKFIATASLDPLAEFTQAENILVMAVLVVVAILACWSISGAQYAHARARGFERRTREIMNNMETRVQILDRSGRIRFVNRATTIQTGRPREDFMGHTIREAYDSETARILEDINHNVWNGGPLETHERTFPDGRTYLVSAFRLSVIEGSHESMCITSVDITKQKYAEAEAREARRIADDANLAKSRFLASMSHEFRTPMNAIIGYSEMLIEDVEGDGNKTYVGDLKRILAAGRHLLALINDVLDLSKIEAGRMDLFVDGFDLPALIDEVSATVEPLIEKNGNKLEISLGEMNTPLRNDATRLRQIVLNLMSNAAKFTKNGTIALDCSLERVETREWLTITVSDTGIGMNDEQIARLFREFSQMATQQTKAGEGSGLGLNISRRLAHMMGGDITVESTLGQGSRFTVRVPARVDQQLDEPTPAMSVTPEKVAPFRRTSGPVLVIDDEADARELLARYLTREGFQVVTAASGEEGLLRARQVRPVAITLDVVMGKMDGWEVLQQLAADEELRHIPVIMCTIVDERGKSLSLGAVDYITKPVDRQQLLRAIENALGASPANRRVLVVDDEEINRRQIARLLEDEGVPFETAVNGAEALDRLRYGGSFGLVLLDLLMPGMDGFEFLRDLRANSDWDRVAVVIVTSKSLSIDEMTELRKRAHSVISRNGGNRDQVLASIKQQILFHIERAGIPAN